MNSEHRTMALWAVALAAALLIAGGCAQKAAVDVELLVKELESGTAAEQQSAAAALVASGKAAIDPLLKLLTHADPAVPPRAVRTLGQLAVRETVGTADRNRMGAELIKLAACPDEAVRREVAVALGSFPQVANVPGALLLRLKDSSGAVMAAASDSLVKIGPDAVSVLALVHSVPERPAKVTDGLPEKEAALLLPALAEIDPALRAVTIRQLMPYRDSRIPPALIQVLTDTDATVRRLAVAALAAYDSPQVSEALAKALDDEDPAVAVLAAQVLTERASVAPTELQARASAFLAQIRSTGLKVFAVLEKQLPEVRDDTKQFKECLEKLTELEPQRVVEILVEQLDPDRVPRVGVRYAAAKLLAGIALKSKDERALRALSRILTSQDSAKPGELKEKNARVLVAAARALGGSGDEQAVRLLVKLLGSEDQTVRLMAKQALGEADASAVPALLLEENLKNPNVNARCGIAYALGKIGEASAAPQLLELLKDSDAEVRPAAIIALGELRNPMAIEPLAALLNTPDARTRWFVLRALDRFGSDAEAAALNALDEPAAALAALELLGSVGSSSSIGRLLPLLTLPDRQQALAAAHALEGILRRQRERLEAQEGLVSALAGAVQELSKVRGVAAKDAAAQAEARLAMAAALGYVRSESAERVLLALVANDREESVRVAAAVAYGRSAGRPTSVVEALEAALQEPDEALRLAALQGLAREGKLSAASAIAAAAQANPNERFRSEARRAYRKITGVELAESAPSAP